MRIALDLDGVLANTMKVWLEIWNAERFPRLEYESVDEWDFWKRLGITEAEFGAMFSRAWSRWPEIPPAEDRLAEKVRALSELGKVDVVTGRPKEDERHIRSWLELHSVEYRALVIGVARKAELGYDVYIDDSPRLAEDLVGRRGVLLLRDQPWNKSVRDDSKVRRIRGLEDAIGILGGEGVTGPRRRRTP
ncbi:MAG: hypothetical protein N3H32_03425 [Nitrososphaeria archaeon]|nr:hypothetical protein [Nitrososphaeria archaeon]MDW8043756.1 hypothetical protein [Nitrososphaerota archaeon]